MATLLVSRARVPENYMWPSGKTPPVREGKAEIPIIDFHDEKNLVQNIMKAVRELGCFQAINHGVSTDLMNDAMSMFKELHKLPDEEITKINKEQDQKNPVCKIYTSSVNFDKEQVHYWRNVMRQCCHPLDECVEFWPKTPKKYREIIKAYVTGVKNMGSTVLENVSKGLGLDQNYFKNELSEDGVLYINSYPACPDPSSTIGLAKHTDPSLLTILHSGRVPGLQVVKDGQWSSVETPPDAFLVFVGNMLEAVSNGKLRTTVHAVRNATEARTSAAFFINPSKECIIEPAKHLIEDESVPPVYKTFKYEEFYETFKNGSGDRDTVLAETFKTSHDS